MPRYDFINDATGEIKEVILSMNEPKVYKEKGKFWRRLFSIPQASFDTEWDENSARDFADKTGKKKGSLGDLFSQSNELSEKRAHKLGVKIDPVKQQKYDERAKKAHGKRCLGEIREQAAREVVI